MTIKREQQLIKRGIDPDLYEMSGNNMKQYRIDIKNLVDSITAIEAERQAKKKLRRTPKRKTKKAIGKKK